jgi:hypothetical protein
MSGQQHQREFELSAPTDTGCTSKETSLARDYSMVSSPSIDFNDETPRHSMELERVVSWIPPASPSGTKKTRSRAAQFLPRTDSLRESKVRTIYRYFLYVSFGGSSRAQGLVECHQVSVVTASLTSTLALMSVEFTAGSDGYWNEKVGKYY